MLLIVIVSTLKKNINIIPDILFYQTNIITCGHCEEEEEVSLKIVHGLKDSMETQGIQRTMQNNQQN